MKKPTAHQQPEFFDSRRPPQARWRAAAEARAIARAALTDEDWQRLDRLLFVEAKWIRAKTMPDIPHSYCRRRDFEHDADFVWLVETIRRIGDRERYPPGPRGRLYDVLNRHGRKIWPMGWPVSMTVLLNKKPQEPEDR